MAEGKKSLRCLTFPSFCSSVTTATMNDIKNFEGTWFLPYDSHITDSVTKFRGSLTFDPDNGSILVLRIDQINNPRLKQDIDIFLGNTSEGPVTLYKCLCSRHDFGRGAVYYYHVQYVIQGGHLHKEQEFQFSRINARLYGLNEWVAKTGFKVTSKDYSTKFKVEYQLPKNIPFKINESLKGVILFGVSGIKFGSSQLHVDLKQSTEVAFETKVLLPLDKILNILTVFSNFLMMGLDDTTYATRITLYSNIHVETFALGRKIRRVPFRLLIPRPVGTDIRKVANPQRMFFKLDAVKGRIEKLISNWFVLFQRNESSLNLFFKQYQWKHESNPTIFLNYAQVAEAYHAVMQKQIKKKHSTEFLKMKRQILTLSKQQLPQYANWLSEQFNRYNALTLHDRLFDLVQQTKSTQLYEALGDTESFISNAKINRNYYTHYNRNKKHQAFTGVELYHLTRKLHVLIIFHLLNDIGLSRKDIANRIVQYFHLS